MLSEKMDSALLKLAAEPAKRVGRSNRAVFATNPLSPSLGLLGPNKKRTIPSIPCMDKEAKTIGPWSYTPNHNLVSQSVKNSVRMV